jgi:hypothetical protein
MLSSLIRRCPLAQIVDEAVKPRPPLELDHAARRAMQGRDGARSAGLQLHRKQQHIQHPSPKQLLRNSNPTLIYEGRPMSRHTLCEV